VARALVNNRLHYLADEPTGTSIRDREEIMGLFERLHQAEYPGAGDPRTRHAAHAHRIITFAGRRIERDERSSVILDFRFWILIGRFFILSLGSWNFES